MKAFARITCFLLCFNCLYSIAEEYPDSTLLSNLRIEAERKYQELKPSFFHRGYEPFGFGATYIPELGMGWSIYFFNLYTPIANRLCLSVSIGQGHFFPSKDIADLDIYKSPENSSFDAVTINYCNFLPTRFYYVFSDKKSNNTLSGLGIFFNIADSYIINEILGYENDSSEIISHNFDKPLGSYGMELILTDGQIGIKMMFLRSSIFNYLEMDNTNILLNIWMDCGVAFDEKRNWGIKSSYYVPSNKQEKRKEKIEKWVSEQYIKRSQDCDLVIEEVEFSDASSILPNNSIDAYEHSCISVFVKNNGPGVAFGVNIVPACDNSNVAFDSALYHIGDLSPGKEANVNIGLSADSKLEDGAVQIIVYAKEKRKQDALEQPIEIKTNRLRSPALITGEIILNDRQHSGFADGDGDGILETGEVGELNIEIVNEGGGPGLGIEANLFVPKGVSIEPVENIPGKIYPGKNAWIKYRVILPTDYNKDELRFTMRLKDLRPIHLPQLRGEIPTATAHPQIDMSVKAYGGFSNGETYPVIITISNKGNADAKDCRIILNSPPGVRIDPHEISFDRFLRNEIEPVAATVEIDRTYLEPKIEFSGTVTTSNFEPIEVKCTYPVEIRIPELGIETYLLSGNTLMSGRPFEIMVRPVNSGALNAKDVVVEVNTLNEYYQKQRIKRFGNLSPLEGYSEILSFPKIPRGIEGKEIKFSVSVEQKEFPAFDTLVTFPIVRDSSEIIKIDPEKDLPPLGPSMIVRMKTQRDTVKGLTMTGYCLIGEHLTEIDAREFALKEAIDKLKMYVTTEIISRRVAENKRLKSDITIQKVRCEVINFRVIEEESGAKDYKDGRKYKITIIGDVVHSIDVE